MYFCKKQKIPYTKSMANKLIPELIKNSKSLKPFQITPFAGFYVFFVPKSKITWNKDFLILENFFYDNYRDFHTGYCLDGVPSIKQYPYVTTHTIHLHPKELMFNNFYIIVEPCEEIVIGNNRNIKLQNIKIGDMYSECEKEIKTLLSAYKFTVFQKTQKKHKQIHTFILKEDYNLTENYKFGFDFEPLFSNNNDDILQVIDNYTEDNSDK